MHPLDAAWLPLLDEVTDILTTMPRDGAQRLYDLWMRVPARHPRGEGQTASPLWPLREILIRLSHSWFAYRLFRERPGVPATNNGSERAIGKLKVRSHAVRGYKSLTGLQAMFQLCAA